MKKTHIYTIDTLLIAAALFAIIFTFVYLQPDLNSPDNGAVATGAVLFSFDKADIILIDDNINFSSPMRIEAEDNIAVNLEPGVYYWRAEGLVPSEIRQLTIESRVELKIREANGTYELVNAGNEELSVDIYEYGKLTGKMILGKDESADLEGDKFIGGKNGE